MPTECSLALFEFAPVEGRAVVAGFDGGAITSDAGALLLGTTDRAIGLVRRFAACFRDGRAPERVEHEIPTLVGQRVFGIALGYEDVMESIAGAGRKKNPENQGEELAPSTDGMSPLDASISRSTEARGSPLACTFTRTVSAVPAR